MNLRRIDQMLSHSGYCSRSEARIWVKRGRVTVRGVPCRASDDKAAAGDVLVDGAPLDCPEGLLAVLHKPVGCVCSRNAREGALVYDLLPERWSRRNPPVTTVGRLDRDASGVLLVTDLGTIVQRLTSPRHHVAKVYEVVLSGPADPSWVERLGRDDFELPGEDKPCRPSRVEIGADPCRVQLELVEGRFHQVKRMFAVLGREVVSLHRSRFGEYDVAGLAPGEWRLVPCPPG